MLKPTTGLTTYQQKTAAFSTAVFPSPTPIPYHHLHKYYSFWFLLFCCFVSVVLLWFLFCTLLFRLLNRYYYLFALGALSSLQFTISLSLVIKERFSHFVSLTTAGIQYPAIHEENAHEGRKRLQKEKHTWN